MEVLKQKKKKLLPKHEMFCKVYASEEFFCNGVRSYMKVYKDSSYTAARVSAYDLLTKPNILARIDELIEDGGLNNSFVDKQLKKLITQDADFGAKNTAIKEYNQMKRRTDTTKTININFSKEADDRASEYDD